MVWVVETEKEKKQGSMDKAVLGGFDSLLVLNGDDDGMVVLVVCAFVSE